ncbi:sulfatase-like hydrolase/transferase [Photorhabdus heterorhabditis]|uniref:Sulfatase-like hydrolase/transferase n=1 Tax=Photorhabdus heterorhabditis TaxID=880156 RepID=A0A5B0WYX7_9GAMM|nr:sulfatase-like hydrolase/transferase [Photorhabdus heterorhabditis]KAA1192270.1 sulfatase-like hydrolase/transferase [Photorhabdus heterorhabditis]MBS9441823.1 phosphoethanolamine transferase [Photorhabdus heterorhabditis]
MPLSKKIRETFILMCLFGFITLAHLSLGYQLKLIYVFSAFSILILLSNFSYLIYYTFIFAIGLIGVIYSPVGLTYGYPDINSIGSLIYTNKNETIEFISGLPLFTYLVVLVTMILMLLSLKVKVTLKKSHVGFLSLFFVLSAFWSPVRGYIQSDFDPDFNLLASGLPEVRFFSDIVESYNEVNSERVKFAEIIKQKDSWQPIVEKNKYETYIMVIGESVRKDFMNTYGFPYNNTPWLNKANAKIFTNYISSAASTQLSLTNSLALRNDNSIDLNNSIITLAKKAGFYTYWISNQGIKSAFDSPVALIGQQADSFNFLKSGSSDDRRYLPDDKLMPYIKKALTSEEKKKFIVIHLMGSHPQACVRTNGKYDLFLQSEEISCYVKSIDNTDNLLSEIASEANHHHSKWTMMYFSDHGLSYIDKGTEQENLTHNDRNKQSFQVPFFITGSDYHHREEITEQRSGLHFLTLFSQWLGIREKNIPSDCNMLSNGKCSGQDNIITFKGEVKNYDKLGEDFLDVQFSSKKTH